MVSMQKKEEIMEKLSKGELKLHQIDNYTTKTQEAVDLRREFVEKVSGTSLKHLSHYSLDMDEAMKRNIENPIGTIQIPVGLAGPLHINGEHVKGDYYIPLATSKVHCWLRLTGDVLYPGHRMGYRTHNR
jgi:hydroxymethylglutaryl-CoA reductase (NADPH)